MLRILSADYAGDYSLICTFSNGHRKIIDLSPLLVYPAYKDLKDKKVFEQFGLAGTVFWMNGADIAPEWLFQHGLDA